MDQEIVEELLSRIRTNPDGTSTLNDLIDVWLTADQSVRKKIQNYSAQIEEHKRNRDETAIQLKAVKDHEAYNPNHLIEDSKLNIELFEGQGFVSRQGIPFEPIVYVFCEKQRYQMDHPMKKGSGFVWNSSAPLSM